MAAPSHLLHHLFRPPPPPPSSLLSLFLKPTLSLCLQTPLRPTFFRSLPTPLLPFRYSSSSSSSSSSFSLPDTTSPLSLNPKYKSPGENEDDMDYDDDDDDDDEDEEGEEEEEEEDGIGQQLEELELKGTVNESPKAVKVNPPPSLSVKEKKELAAYAHSLGKKLKSQLVGKSGVTASVASSFIETLEANELLKIKIHGTCPGELPDVVKQLEEVTGSVVVGQIGRAVILYRPSLTRMKAEEKKRQARRIYVRKEQTLKPTFLKKGPPLRLSGRGHRGGSRV